MTHTPIPVAKSINKSRNSHTLPNITQRRSHSAPDDLILIRKRLKQRLNSPYIAEGTEPHSSPYS